MTIKPSPVPPERAALDNRPRPPRATYDWASIEYGTWQNWLNLPDDVDDADAMRACTRIRIAGLGYARKHRLTLETRRTRKGRTLDMRFDVPVAQ